MVIVRVSYTGTDIPRVGSGRSITEPTLTPVACGAIRYAIWRLNKRTGEMLIKNFVGSFPLIFLALSFFLLFLLSVFPHFLLATTKEHNYGPSDGGALELLSGPGRSIVWFNVPLDTL